ncbi:hypothetical protein NKI34_29125 [Mesorhizobium sp. M0700]|uniref:hypothetical protein n=1 Tax=Mesorhizobium sp. M0700 TaxID=2956988 RepID=UPI00333810F4
MILGIAWTLTSVRIAADPFFEKILFANLFFFERQLRQNAVALPGCHHGGRGRSP